jgi:dolichyl-phosphate beta-glucosyltransferase
VITRATLSVVIPAFNESARIGRTLEELRAQLPRYPFDWDIRVVDDGSEDDTAAIVERAARADARIVLQREPHRGKGGAVRSGLIAARGDLRFLCDADLSMPVSEMSRFFDEVPAHCDIALGSREGAGARRVGEPLYRHVMGRAFNALVQTILLPGINDTQCGFKLFSARAVDAIIPSTTIDGWAFDLEILFLAQRMGFRVKEIPIEWHYGEHSRVSAVGDSWRMTRDLLKIRLNSTRGAYPSLSESPHRSGD